MNTTNNGSNVLMAMGFGALLGLAAYDINNLATIKGWSRTVTAADIVWGCSSPMSRRLSVVTRS